MTCRASELLNSETGKRQPVLSNGCFLALSPGLLGTLIDSLLFLMLSCGLCPERFSMKSESDLCVKKRHWFKNVSHYSSVSLTSPLEYPNSDTLTG